MAEATTLTVGPREVRITSPSRVLWPDLGITKLDLESGLGELPFPHDLAEMPGEPPRVQPSQAERE